MSGFSSKNKLTPPGWTRLLENATELIRESACAAYRRFPPGDPRRVASPPRIAPSLGLCSKRACGPFCAGTPRSSGPLIHSLLPASHGSLPVFGKLFARKNKRLGSGDFGFALPGMLTILPTLNPSSPAKVPGRADESAQSCDRGSRAGDGAGSLSERGRGAVGVAGAAAGGPAAAG